MTTKKGNNKDKCFLFPIPSPCGRHVSNNGLYVNNRKMFLIAFSVFGLCFNALRSFFFFFFWSLFLFPETIPSGACYMLMRLDNERLSPGREAKRKCRCRDFTTIWQLIFFPFFCIQTNQTHKRCGFFFLYLLWKSFV